jgi:outer membrane protein W
MLLKRFLLLLALVTAWVTAPASAQTTTANQRWTFTTRVLMTGSSDESDPPGYQVYSTFALEAGLRRVLGTSFSAELNIHTESREVDSLVPEGEDRRLGSLELLPLNLFLQYRRSGGSLHPYAGLGVNATFAWERSGVLDSVDMQPSFGPAIQIGTDLDLSPQVLLNADLKWNRFRADLENGGVPFTSIRMDPLALGVGVGFRF